jgi:hypothetical protein
MGEDEVGVLFFINVFDCAPKEGITRRVIRRQVTSGE